MRFIKIILCIIQITDRIIMLKEGCMENFISLVCPSCGGKLKVDTLATQYECEYCHQTHLLKQDHRLLEQHAKCPICNRNDRTRKVSSILAAQEPLGKLLEAPPEPDYHDVKDNIKKPSPPIKYKNSWYVILFNCLFGILIGLIIIFSSFLPIEEKRFAGFVR